MRITARKIIISLLIVALLSVVSLYTYSRAYNLIFGPLIIIKSPKNGDVFEEDLITIDGNTKNVTELLLNDREIFMDISGKFSEDFLLLYGYNIIEITARDRFGKESKEVLKIVYQ